MDPVNTRSKNKKVTLIELLILLAVLIIMVVYDILTKKRKNVILLYTVVMCLKEARNNFIEIVTSSGEKFLIHAEYNSKMRDDDSARMLNSIVKETQKRSDQTY